MPKADALSVRYRWGIVANAAVDEMIRLMFGMNLRPENLATINLKEQLYHGQFAPEAANNGNRVVVEAWGRNRRCHHLIMYVWPKIV